MDFDIADSFSTKGGNLTLEGKITTPDTLVATMNFGQVPVVWQHRLWGPGDLNTQFNNGIFFYGEKATLFASDNKLVLMPAGKNKSQQEMDIPTPDMQDRHVADFVNAVKAKNKNLLSCTIDDAALSTAAVQLAMISYYTGTDVVWNADNKQIENNKRASDLLARKYRSGYKHPGT